MKAAAVASSPVSVREAAPRDLVAARTLSPGSGAVLGDWSERPAHLTPRQQEVLSLLCEGLPNKLICRRLNISAGTVKVHIGTILKQLGVTSRLQAVVSAQRSGLPGGLLAGVPGDASLSGGFAAF